MPLVLVVVVIFKGIALDAVVGHLVPDRLLEAVSLVEGQAVRFGNDGYDIDDVCELLHDDNVDGFQAVPAGPDKVQAAVNARVDNVPVAHRSELLAEVGRVLVLDVLDDGVPAGMASQESAGASAFDSGSLEKPEQLLGDPGGTHHPSLLIMSPKPGVSTMFRRSFTLFSWMTAGWGTIRRAMLVWRF